MFWDCPVGGNIHSAILELDGQVREGLLQERRRLPRDEALCNSSWSMSCDSCESAYPLTTQWPL